MCSITDTTDGQRACFFGDFEGEVPLNICKDSYRGKVCTYDTSSNDRLFICRRNHRARDGDLLLLCPCDPYR